VLCPKCVPSGVFDHPKDGGGVGLDVAAEHRLDVLPAAGVGDVLGRQSLPLTGPQAPLWVKYATLELGELGLFLGLEEQAGCDVAPNSLLLVLGGGEQRYVADSWVLGEVAVDLLLQPPFPDPGRLT